MDLEILSFGEFMNFFPDSRTYLIHVGNEPTFWHNFPCNNGDIFVAEAHYSFDDFWKERPTGKSLNKHFKNETYPPTKSLPESDFGLYLVRLLSRKKNICVL